MIRTRPIRDLLSQRRGSLLIPLVVGIVIIGVLTITSGAVVVQAWKTQQSVETRAAIVSLRNFVTASLDCDATFPARPPECDVSPPSNTYVPVRTQNAGAIAEFISVPVHHASTVTYTKVGVFGLRASCIPCTTCSSDRKLLIEYARVDSAGNPQVDPATGLLMNWRDLLAGVPSACLVPAP